MKRGYEKILKFWFEDIDKSFWFKEDRKFDEKIKTKFENLLEKANRGEAEDWKENPKASLAFIILLDQFPRNIYRENKKSFAFDEKALETAKESIEKGFDKLVNPEKRVFFYMPFMHSEDLKDQKLSQRFFKKLSEENKNIKENLKYAIKHKEIIERFGRFPHRNKILGRESTKEEKDFLKKEGRGF